MYCKSVVEFLEYYFDKNTIIHQSADATIEYFQKIENLKKYEDIKQMITNL